MSDKRIQSALISVFYKDGLDDIVRMLHELDVKIYSTGGTFSFINDLGIPAEKVEILQLILQFLVEGLKHFIRQFSEEFLPGGIILKIWTA